MEHSYKKAAAAVIALALIAAVILGIVLASNTSPTAIPSGEAESSLSTVNAQIASDVKIGSVDEELDPSDHGAVQAKWNMPGAEVKPIATEPELKDFLHQGSDGKIGVLTADITYTVSSESDIGREFFKGVLDGNGHTITLKGESGTGAIGSFAYVNTDTYGIRENLQIGDYVDGKGIDGINAAGLLVGANEGTIANLVINYSSKMALPTKTNSNQVVGENLLSSAENPEYMTSFGIVSGINFGTIDNVKVNVEGNFVGRQRSSSRNLGSEDKKHNARSIENTAIVGTLTGILARGSISNTHVDIANGVIVAATADNREVYRILGGIPDTSWRNAIAIAGGMVGFFVGNEGMLQDSYLSGSGNVQAAVYRGENSGLGKGYNAFSGGITGGKFKINDGLRDPSEDINYSMIESTGAQVGGLGSQIQGIVVSWTGNKLDNNNGNDEDHNTDGMPVVYRNEPGTLIDTANFNGGSPVIALTYDYDTLPWVEGSRKTGISNTGDVKDWTEVYHSGGSADVTVEVKVADGNFRIQAATKDFKGTQSYRPLENEPNRTIFQTLPSGYTGEFIWAVRQDKPTAAAGVTPMTLQDHTRRIGAMVYTIAYSQRAAFEIVFGTMAEYGVTYQEVDGRNYTAMRYDGAPVNEPTLSLTAAGETVSVQQGAYSWLYQRGATEVKHDDTMFPGTYTFRPRLQVVDDEGKVTATYAYLDETNRVVVPEGQGSPLTFNVLEASFNVSAKPNGLSSGKWMKEAAFTGTLNTSGYATYGQTAPSGDIFDAFTYQANNAQSDYQEMSGLTFSFFDKETTAAAGRVYNNFTVYKQNSAGEYVAVGTASVNLTVCIDNAAPVLEDVRYYTYSGDVTGISSQNVAQHYFKIKEGDSAYTDVTDKIGDGGWTKYNLFIIVTATDERRSGINSTSGVQVEVQSGESGAPISIQSQINYGSEEGQDLDLGTGNAAAIGYISSSATLRVQLRDSLENSGITPIGSINVDTVPLKLDSVLTSGYVYYKGAASKDALGINFGTDNAGITVGPSGAEIQYLIVDKTDIDATSTDIPEGYADAWVTLGDYFTSSSGVSYTINESFKEGAAVFVKAVSKEGLYDDCMVRLYADSGVTAEQMENGKYPYFYVDLITASLLIPDEAILIDGVALSEIADKNAAFAKQYDGSDAFLALTNESLIGEQDDESAVYYRNADGKIVERATGRIFKMVTIDWNKVTASLQNVILADAIAAVQNNGYIAVGAYTQYEGVGNTVLTWSFEVGNAASDGYKYELVFGDSADLYEREMTVDTYIDYRDYDIGVEGIVKGDADFANYLDADANTVTTTYWGTNAMPFPVDFHASTGFGDDIYFRYAYIGGENGVFNAGGNYKIAVDAVKIVPETETPEDTEWVEFELDENGNGDLPKYDNYNFHFTTKMQLVVKKIGVLTFTSLNRLVNDGEGGQVLAPEDMTTKISYDGFTHVVSATYSDVYKEVVNAVVEVYGDPDHLTKATINDVGKYYVVLKPEDEVNYYIAAGAEQVFEVVSTTIDLDTADQSYAYNNGSAVDFVVRDGDGTLISVEGSGDSYEVIYFDEKGIKLDKAPTEIGDYEVYVVYTAGAGSKYSTGRFAAMLTINKATPKILGVTENAVIYDKGLHTYVVPDDPDNTEDGLKMVNDYLDGSSVYEFADAEKVLVLQYLVEDGDPNNEDDWQNVDTVGQGEGWFKDAGAYTFRYRYGGDSHYNAVTSDPVTFTINKAVYGTQSTIPTDFLLFKDNTNTAIPTAGTSGSGDDGLPIYTVDYNAKSQYLTAKSETFFDYSGAEPVALEPGAEITYYREGNLLDTTRPETLNMQLAQDYLVTVTITSNNYQDFVYQMHYVIATIDIPQGAITVTTEGGVNITTGTSAEDPQPLSVTYDGKEHGYRADNSGEIIIKYDRTKLLEYDPENASSTPANASITYYPDGNQSNTLVNVGSYSGYYLISVGLTNYKPIRVYVTMTITPADAVATIEKDESITNVTSETNINNVMSGTFIDVNGNEQQGTLVFTDASGNPATPDDQGRLPAGTYTVTVVDSSGNYVLKGETASLTIAEPDASHVHTDVDGNNVCDSCGANVTGIHVHVDADGDGICDGCKQQIGGDQPQPHDHVDANGDGKCDICGAAMNNQGGNDPVDDPDDGGNTAVIVGGVLIGATALIVAGTVVGAILIVRKKRKNVI